MVAITSIFTDMDAGTIQDSLIATGLSKRELALIIDVFEQSGNVRRAILFCSAHGR